MGKGPAWTEEEEEFLAECVAEGVDKFKISEQFHIRTNMNIKGYHKRSPDAIKRRIYDLPTKPVDASKPGMHRKRWSPEEDRVLLHLNALGMSKEDMAVEFGRTESAVESRLQFLKKQRTFWEIACEGFSEIVSRMRSLFGSRLGGK